MGHLFEKRKICHGCQGNYHSERKGGGAGCGRKKKKEVQQLLWIELDFGGILSLQDKQQRACSLFLLSFSVSLSPLIPLSTYPTVCQALIFPSPFPVSFPPLFFLSFSIPHAAASSEISVWNLPPIRGLNPTVQPPAAHPWQLFRCLKRLMRGAETHLTLPGNWSLFRTGRDKCASPSASKCKLNGPSLCLH